MGRAFLLYTILWHSTAICAIPYVKLWDISPERRPIWHSFGLCLILGVYRYVGGIGCELSPCIWYMGNARRALHGLQTLQRLLISIHVTLVKVIYVLVPAAEHYINNPGIKHKTYIILPLQCLNLFDFHVARCILYISTKLYPYPCWHTGRVC